jgi:tetratricopeptide (TPR) repeat protein
MKNRIYLILFSLFLGFNAMAQNSDECAQNLSIFAENAKVKNYGAAYEPWSLVRNDCPDLNIAIYAYGERILKERLKNSPDSEKPQRETDLIELYNDWIKFFPTKKGRNDIGNILSAKAQTMIDFKIGSDNEIYSIFDDAFKKDRKSFSNPKRLYNYFKVLYEIYKGKNENVTPEKLFEKYEDVSEKFEFESVKLAKNLDIILKKEESGEALTTKDLKNKRIYGVNSNAISIYLKNLDAIISKESSCENLIPLYERNFDQNRENIVWLKRAASRMDAKDCSDSQLFVNLVEALHSIQPSADSAYYLGLLNDKKGDNKQALSYYEESIELEDDPYKKAKTLYKIALKFKQRGSKRSARSYALKALAYQPSLGKAYLMIANLYATSANDCGKSQFEKRAVYWLAANTAKKAANVDASIKKSALKSVAAFNGRAPTKTDIFTDGMEGKVIQFSCWINDKVKVPKL